MLINVGTLSIVTNISMEVHVNNVHRRTFQIGIHVYQGSLVGTLNMLTVQKFMVMNGYWIQRFLHKKASHNTDFWRQGALVNLLTSTLRSTGHHTRYRTSLWGQAEWPHVLFIKILSENKSAIKISLRVTGIHPLCGVCRTFYTTTNWSYLTKIYNRSLCDTSVWVLVRTNAHLLTLTKCFLIKSRQSVKFRPWHYEHSSSFGVVLALMNTGPVPLDWLYLSILYKQRSYSEGYNNNNKGGTSPRKKVPSVLERL